MARATKELVKALMETAQRLRGGARYQWGHMGSCNCGHLAQTLTNLPKAEIHAMALRRAGDWGEQAVEYCPTSGLPLDHVISTMLDCGLTLDDITKLENLSDIYVLRRIPMERRPLRRNIREDAVLYMETWAKMLREELPPAPLTPLPVSPAISPLPQEEAA